MINKNTFIAYTIPTLTLYLNDIKLVPAKNRINLKSIRVMVNKVFDLILDKHKSKTAKGDILRFISRRGKINKLNVEKILSNLNVVINGRTPSVFSKNYEMSHLIIKLITHIISPYSNKIYFKERKRYYRLAKKFANEIADTFPRIGVILCGSLERNDSLWHPFYSDIDLIPIRQNTTIRATLIRKKYKNFKKPKWLYINYGGKKGIGNLKSDPLNRMYVTNQLLKLPKTEIKYLYGLYCNGYKILAGNRSVISNYFNILNGLNRSHFF